jgi:hypothetical protein
MGLQGLSRFDREDVARLIAMSEVLLPIKPLPDSYPSIEHCAVSTIPL